MHATRARYVAVCQQVLAVGVVLAVVTPAADVVTLDVVAPASAVVKGARPGSGGLERALVPDAPVRPVVREVALRPTTRPGVTGRSAHGAMVVTSGPEPVDDFGTVGVSWGPGPDVEEGALVVRVRTLAEGVWSDWSEVPYDPDHGPDGPEARGIRSGTDAVVVGDVEAVQVRAVSRRGPTPQGMRLAVVTPGRPSGSTVQAPAIEVDPAPGTSGAAQRAMAERGVVTAKPRIFSRAQWGADERMRNGGPRYFEVHAGFVHHTVNANDYGPDDVPSILRGIYAYHTRSLGWDDVGYNFLVDRFGRIWEGRYGGVSRPVVGAHTEGYNDYSFAMSAIGNFESARPTSAMLDAYAKLMAWKLSLHGVDVSSTRQWVGSRSFPAINGHRDAGSTACPGRYLYAELSTIRGRAAGYQRDWSGRQRHTDQLSTGHPDLVVRRARDGQAFVLPTLGLMRFRAPSVVARTGWDAKDVIVAMPDVTGDGRPDLFARDRDTGTARVHPGTSAGGFGPGIRATGAFAGIQQITSPGDLDGDGRRDLVGRDPSTGRLLLFAGTGGGSFARQTLGLDWSAYDRTVGIGDFDRDGHRDLLARDREGRLWLVPGRGAARFGERVQLPGRWDAYNVLAGFGDYDRDGRVDLFARNGRTGRSFVFPGWRGTGFRHWQGPLVAPRGISHLSSPGNLAGSAAPDLVGRRDGSLVVLRHAGTRNAGRLHPIGSLAGVRTVLNVGDWDRDGDGDLVVRRDGDLFLRSSDGAGSYAEPVRIGRGFGRVGLLAAVGDLTGDGLPDLMGQPTGGSMRIYPGRGRSGLGVSYVAHSALRAWRLVGVGLWSPDGAPDVMLRLGDRLTLRTSNGPGGLMAARSLRVDVGPYDWVLGMGQLNGWGREDLVVRARRTGDLWVLPGVPGGFGQRVFLRGGFSGFDLAG